MKELIAKVVEGKDLTEEEAKKGMEILLSGEATQAQIGSFLTALRMKGETLEELVGFASVLRDKAETISPKVGNYVDLVGTGGDCTYTFNISTTSAFAVAAAGLPVAKHGNRSISSKSGAGDVLEELGVNIMAEPATVERCVNEAGIKKVSFHICFRLGLSILIFLCCLEADGYVCADAALLQRELLG